MTTSGTVWARDGADTFALGNVIFELLGSAAPRRTATRIMAKHIIVLVAWKLATVCRARAENTFEVSHTAESFAASSGWRFPHLLDREIGGLR